MSHRKYWKRACSLAPLPSLGLAEHCQRCRWKPLLSLSWGRVTQSPKCHLACGVFKSVHEGSYGKTCSPMAQSGLGKGSRGWETVKWNHLTAVSTLWSGRLWRVWQSFSEMKHLNFMWTPGVVFVRCVPGRNRIHTVSSHVSWTL